MRVLAGATIICSSLLLLLVQPMMAKTLVPWFGGSAGVWVCAMLFFQAALLVGYAYAHYTTRYLRPRAQTAVHLLLLAASLTALPILPNPAWKPPAGSGSPLAHLLAILTVTVGLPYLALSTTSPLVQAWYARRAKSALPYRLFAVSNAASLAALVAYPFLMEPLWAARRQMLAWSWAYGIFLVLASAAALFGGGASRLEPVPAQTPPRSERLLWVTLAACPSILWLATANTLSQSVAPVPLLWILPLSLYLLSFVLCFDRQGWYHPAIYRFLLPAGWILMGLGLGAQRLLDLPWIVLCLSAGLLLCSLFCHGELARRKPASGQLTSFYLMLAVGGALGGVFVAVLAPMVFNAYLELPIGVVACALLALRLLFRVRPRQVARIALTSTAGLIFALQMDAYLGHTLVRIRNFYGRLEVSDQGDARILSNGPIRHGAEFLDAARQALPTAYFGTDSGIGLAMRFFGDQPKRVGVIGLGAGTLAAYCRPGDRFVFYEINPAVIQVAYADFNFLGHCPNATVVASDGRLALESETRQSFDMLVVDAFSGDSIPAHLLTREASALYFSLLKADGVLAVHISNRYLDLAPVVAALAAGGGRPARLIRSAADPSRNIYDATWTVVSSNQRLLDQLASASEPLAPRPGFRAWTDDYSNLFQVLR